MDPGGVSGRRLSHTHTHTHTHRAVRIKLSAAAKNYLITAAKRPKQFEKRTPVGCARQPVLPRWAKPVSTQSQSAAIGGHAVATGGSVDLLWPELCHAMETELARLHGCVSAEGLAARAYSGRAQGLRKVNRIALPMRASSSLGKVSIPAHALAWLGTRVKQIGPHVQKSPKGPPGVLQGLLSADGHNE